MSFFPHFCCCWLAQTKQIFISFLFFDNHPWTGDFFFSHALASQVEQTISHTMYTNSLFLGILLTMWEPWWHFQWKHHQILAFSFFLVLSGGWDFYSAHLVIRGGRRIVILLWISYIFALIIGRASIMPSYAYPGSQESILSLCMLVTSGSPCESILLVTLNIWLNACFIASHAALCHTHTLILK